ncbi:alanyl-tRNA editing protein AlaX, partial [Candidatus Micrarchaeota archaeon CG11_big_fil_rev_8_21_14_0_20_47_5]
MDSEPLYLKDSYVKECQAKVVSVKDGKFAVLDANLFYPRGGGQPQDTGKLVRGGEEFSVLFAGKFEGKISHEVDREGLKEGDSVHCILNWERRYRLMRSHTAAHTLATILNKKTGALIT